MAKISIEPYGNGSKIRIENPSGEIGAVIYINANGKVDCDSWIKEEKVISTTRKQKIPFNPSARE